MLSAEFPHQALRNLRQGRCTDDGGTSHPEDLFFDIRADVVHFIQILLAAAIEHGKVSNQIAVLGFQLVQHVFPCGEQLRYRTGSPIGELFLQVGVFAEFFIDLKLRRTCLFVSRQLPALLGNRSLGVDKLVS